MPKCTLPQSEAFRLVVDGGKPILGAGLTCGCKRSGDQNCIHTMLEKAKPKIVEMCEQGKLTRSNDGVITIAQGEWGQVIPLLEEEWNRPKPGAAPSARPQRNTIVAGAKSDDGVYLRGFATVLATKEDGSGLPSSCKTKISQIMIKTGHTWLPWLDKEANERLILELASGQDELATSLHDAIQVVQATQREDRERIAVQEAKTRALFTQLGAFAGSLDEKIDEKVRLEGEGLLSKLQELVWAKEKILKQAFSENLTESIIEANQTVRTMKDEWYEKFKKLAAEQAVSNDRLDAHGRRIDQSEQRLDRSEAELKQIHEKLAELIGKYEELKDRPRTVTARVKAALSPRRVEDCGAPDWLLEAAELVGLDVKMDPASRALRSPVHKARTRSPDTVTVPSLAPAAEPVRGGEAQGSAAETVRGDDEPVQMVARELAFTSPQASAAEPGPSTTLARGDDSPASAEEHVRGGEASASAEEHVRGGEASGSAEEPVRGGETSASAEEHVRGGEAPMDRKILEMVDAKLKMVDANTRELAELKNMTSRINLVGGVLMVMVIVQMLVMVMVLIYR